MEAQVENFIFPACVKSANGLTHMGALLCGVTCARKLRLSTVDPANIPPFKFNGQTFPCLVSRDDVYDGDTLKVVIVRNNVAEKHTVRMAGIDAPEMKPLLAQANRAAEMAAAVQARDALRDFIDGQTLEVAFHKHDKYGGRHVGTVYVVRQSLWKASTKIDTSEWMLQHNLARPYDGGKKVPFGAPAGEKAPPGVYPSLAPP